MKIYDLTCDYLQDPIGIDHRTPLLSYRLYAEGEAQFQSEYRILVASSPEKLMQNVGDLWDTGRVESDRSIQHEYAGKPPVSRQRCYWKVVVWDQDGHSSESPVAFWEMGLLRPEDWQAKWITQREMSLDMKHPERMATAPYLRREFEVTKPVKQARLYISGLGYYKLFLNGRTLNADTELDPAYTEYDKTVCYQTYVVENLKQGKNAVAVSLGDGWYNPATVEVWNYINAVWRAVAKLLLQLEITYEDGSVETVASDRSFKTSSGPIVFSQLRNGETYDARLELGDFQNPGYDDSGWAPAEATKAPGGILKAQSMIPIRVMDKLVPVSLKKFSDRCWVADFGENTAGWANISLRGNRGDEITLRYSEHLAQDGHVDQSNIDYFSLTGNFQTDRYILKGEGRESWHPCFTYHGFRYIEITSSATLPDDFEITVQIVRTGLESRGEFACSDETVNKIYELARRSCETNFHGFPTDCPHREKNPWTGDAQLSTEQFLLTLNPMSVFSKWMHDFDDAQRPSGQLPGVVPSAGFGYNWGSGPAWDSALILIPWFQYLYCGDVCILKDSFPAMKRYLAFLDSMAEDGIVGFGLGDWCHPEMGKDESHICETALTDTAYYYSDTVLVSKIAKILGCEDDSERYAEKAAEIRRAFRERFLRFSQGKAAVNGVNCQTAFACPIYQGLCSPEEEGLLLSSLVEEIHRLDDHIEAGILGAKYIVDTLGRYGKGDLLLKIITQRTYPGWGYMVEQGATTLWEFWNGDGSQNHHMYSDVAAGFVKFFAGIRPDEQHPGFQNILFAPLFPTGLDWAEASHISLYGEIFARWERQGETIRYTVHVPVNCSGEVWLPAVQAHQLRPTGQCTALGEKDGCVGFQLLSGEYEFEVCGQ